MLVKYQFLLAIFISFVLSACTIDSHVKEFEEISVATHEYNYSSGIINYLIGAEDTISINVWKNPELSVIVPVRPDGKISMPLIGDIQAAGLSPESVSQDIQKKLQNYIRNPNVTLMVTDLRSHEYLTRIRITGAVTTPSSIMYRQGMTVLDAILAAGSVNDFAAPNDTKLYRQVSGKIHVRDINLGDLLFKGKLKNNIRLMPGDIITIPERLF